MKLVSIICLSLSLAVPTAAANGAKVCVGTDKFPDKNPDKKKLPDGKTQVRIICEGKAEDFGGESGDEATVDCFDSKQTTANSILKKNCKNIKVQIKYKMGNVMSGENGREESNRMYFKFADFGQGNFTKNVGIQEEFTKVSPENEPKEEYEPGKLSTHVYSATVDQCAVDGSNQFFMKMRLKAFKYYVDGNGERTGEKGTDEQTGAQFNFYTATCGTNAKIEFAIDSNTSATPPAPPTPTTPKPSSPTDAPQAAPTAAPQAKPTQFDEKTTSAPQAAPTDPPSAAPQPAPPKKGGKGSLPQAALPEAVPTGKGGKGSLKTKSSPKRRLRRTN